MYRTEKGYSQLAALTPSSFATVVTEYLQIRETNSAKNGVTVVTCKTTLSTAQIIQRRWQINEMKIWSTHGMIVAGESGWALRKYSPSATFAITHRTWTSPRLNPGLRLTASACRALGTQQHELWDISLTELSRDTDRPGIGRRNSNPTRDLNSSFLLHVTVGSGSTPISCPLGIRYVFLGYTATEAWEWSFTSFYSQHSKQIKVRLHSYRYLYGMVCKHTVHFNIYL